MRIGNGNTGLSNQTINYHVDRMRETAGNILSNANKSLAQHETAWANVQRYIERFPDFMQGPVRTLFSLYEARLRIIRERVYQNVLTKGNFICRQESS